MPRSNRLVCRLTLALLLGVAGCSAPRPTASPGEEQAIADSLYFGSVRPDGLVSDEEWQAFVLQEITPRFPQGLTSWQASGQWLSGSGVLQRERSFILYIIHPDTPKDELAIREIIATYRKAFQQESVLRVRSPVWISF
jgi:uncharacterized protein DUF3574